MKMFKLERTIQCDSCPWRKEAKLEDIPHYSAGLHANLACTIAKNADDRPQKVMACHHSRENAEFFCIGWLCNQLDNNNIPLRFLMRRCSNLEDIQLKGEQKETFEETLFDC